MKTLLSILIVAYFLCLTSTAAVNDMFSDSIVISGNNGTVTGSNVDATLEVGEPQFGNQKTVWWTWTAPASGVCNFNTCDSGFDTYLVVYTGNSVTSLSLVAENDDSEDCPDDALSIVCVEVTAGTTYQIQISGCEKASDAGIIKLNWQLGGAFGDWIVHKSVTNTDFNVFIGADLSALSYKYTKVCSTCYRTNNFGCKQWKEENLYLYIDGFTITDKKKKIIVNNQPLEGAGNKAHIEDYNGKQILVYDYETEKLILYYVRKDRFDKGKSQTVKDFKCAKFTGSEIYARQYFSFLEGLKIFDKNLKKEKWEDPLTYGSVNLVSRGVSERKVWNGDNLKITCKKKGDKILTENTLNKQSGQILYTVSDKYGGLLYWVRMSNTNYGLTYIDRKGKKIFDNKLLPEAGATWTLQKFDGKTLYVTENRVTNIFVYLYKLRNLKFLRKQSIVIYNGWVDSSTIDTKAYIMPAKLDNGKQYSAYIYDRKLKKLIWSLPPNYCEISKVGKDSLLSFYSTGGTTLTNSYRVYNKKGLVVEYDYIYDK